MAVKLTAGLPFHLAPAVEPGRGTIWLGVSEPSLGPLPFASLATPDSAPHLDRIDDAAAVLALLQRLAGA